MNTIRLAYGSLHHHGAGLVPDDLEGVDFLLLDGGPVLAPDEPGREPLLGEAFERLAPRLYLDPALRVIVTLAGRNPVAAAQSVGEQLAAAGSRELPIAAVHGSDVLDRLEEFLAEGVELRHGESAGRFTELQAPAVTAAVQLDREPIATALRQGARVVLVGDASADEVFATATGSREAGATPAKYPDLTKPVVDSAAGDPRRPDSEATLRIVTHGGYSASALLEADGDRAVEALEGTVDDWRRRLEREGLPLEGVASRVYQLAAGPAAALATLTYRHRTEAVTRSALRELRQLAATSPPGSPSAAAAGWGVAARYETWPTNLPKSLLEWSVDIRPAEDWVD